MQKSIISCIPIFARCFISAHEAFTVAFQHPFGLSDELCPHRTPHHFFSARDTLGALLYSSLPHNIASLIPPVAHRRGFHMNTRSNPIGIIDSGVGGLTALEQISKILPGENIIYCGDNLNAPYGNRSGEEIVALTRNMLNFLAQNNVKLVAIACNTISATLDTPGLTGYENDYPFQLISIIRSAAQSVVDLNYHEVGVIATDFTIRTGCYTKLIHQIDPTVTVYGEPSPRLAALIEQGDLTSDAIDQEVSHHLTQLLTDHPSVRDIVLGCTHYPIVESVFRRHAPHCAFLNPAQAQAQQVRSQLQTAGLLSHGSNKTVGKLEIHTSGTPPVYETVLAELGITRPYTLTQTNFGAFSNTGA